MSDGVMNTVAYGGVAEKKEEQKRRSYIFIFNLHQILIIIMSISNISNPDRK